jgi:DNA-binding MarR family transcriptional regulator
VFGRARDLRAANMALQQSYIGAVPLAEDLLEAIGLVRRHTRRRVGRLWTDQDVSGAQAELLRLVRRMPGVSVAGAADELGVAANTVSTLVGSLVSAGLMCRTPDPEDRRVARLDLTDSARRRVERWRDARSAAIAEALAGLDAADRAAVAAAVPALTRLAARLRPEESKHA